MFGGKGRASYGRLGLVRFGGLVPSWLPLGTGNVAPLLYADFANARYWYNNAPYASFTAWMTAIGGTFSRASSATYFDVAGVLQTATSNVARFAYDPVLHTALGLRLTGARTNLCLRSEAMSNGAWSANGTGTTVTADTTVAPDGNQTADTLTYTASSTDQLIQTMSMTNGVTYTVSGWMKVASGTKTARFKWNDGLANTYTTDNTVTTTWQRFTVTFAATNTTALGQIGWANGSNAAAGDVVVWGMQFEVGAFASDYVATAGASATEAADSDITGPTGGIPLTGFSATAGTLFVRGKLDDATAHALVQLDDNSANNVISLRNGAFLVTSGGVTQANITRSADTNDDRLAAAWAANDFSFAVNGASVGTDVSGNIPTVDRMRLLATTAASSFGNLKQLGYWPSRLADADLARIAA